MNLVIFLIVHRSYTVLATLLRFAVIRSQVIFQGDYPLFNFRLHCFPFCFFCKGMIFYTFAHLFK
jgi:hypothetical protein